MRNSRLLRIGPASLRLVTFAVKASLAFMLLLLVSAATLGAFAQNRAQNKEQTWGDSWVPQVYPVENTGANFPAPTFPTFAKLPIIRPLPDRLSSPMDFAAPISRAGSAGVTRFNAVENDILGPKPDRHDCTITANYVQPDQCPSGYADGKCYEEWADNDRNRGNNPSIGGVWSVPVRHWYRRRRYRKSPSQPLHQYRDRCIQPESSNNVWETSAYRWVL